LIRIFRSRGEEDVLFQAVTQPPDEFTDMEIILSVITGEKIPVSSENPAKDLQNYLDRIESYFAGEYLRDPDRLRAAREEHYASLRQEQQVFLEKQILSEETIHPKEEKIIPILYYPLMGIILLLLFIVLTTLYMALLDRLFAAFSWDPDSYTMFMGIGAVLLSIATMFLFRRRRQKS
jgi:LPXTG-motif cell wall-anchored protein